MKKSIFKKLGGLFLGLSMAAGVGVAIGSNSKEAAPVYGAGGTFQKITSLSDLKSGSKYLIVSETDNLAFDGSLTSIDAISNTKSVTISSSKITTTTDFYFTITSKTNGYSIKGSGGYYIGSTSSNSNELKNGTSDSYTNTITWDSTNSCFIIRGTNSYLVYNSSSGQTRFRFYKPSTCGNGAGTGSYHKISLFKEQSVTKYTVSFSMQGHGTAPSAQSIEAGGKVSQPTPPSVSGYIFGGWYKEAECNNLWNFTSDTVSANTTLYAKWTAKTALQLDADDVNLKLGDSDETVTVTAGGNPTTGYTLSSGNTNAVTIVDNKLHVVGVGSSTITITKAEDSTNTYTPGTFTVTVGYADITSFELDYTEGTLGKGAETTLPGVTIEPANANQEFSWGDPVATEGIVYTYDSSTHELAIDANNTVEGTIQFTATATGDSSKTATVVYTVQAAQIANITGVTASATGEIVAKQYVGDAFNAQGFSFTPTWSEGDHDAVVITANDISWNALVAGSNPTGTYSCADGDFTVTITGVTVVNDTLVSIAFAEGCDMTNKSYYVGDSWDFSGLSIVGTMDSGKTAPAIASSNVTFSSNDAVATDTTSITVTAEYNNLTATKEISGILVNEVTMDSLTVNYTGGQPVLGADFTFVGSITANMSNGTHPTVNLSDVTIDSVDKFTLNQQTITVTHKTTGATGTFNVQYKAAQYLGPAPVPANTILFNEPFTGFSNSAKPGTSNSSTTVYDGGSVTYTCGESGTKIYTEALAGGTSPELLVAKNGGSFKMAGLPTGSAKVLSFTYACNNTNNEATCDSSAYTMTGSSGSYTLTLKDNTTAPATIDITISNSKSSNTRIDNIQLKITTPADRQVSDEKHAIRIGDVTCSKSPLIAGETISKSDFKIQVQYDTGTALTSNLTPTSVSPTTLVAGTHDYTITYTGSYNDTVTKVIQLTAKAPAVLDSISITKDAGCDDVFTRNDTFTHYGIHVIAHYTDSTEYPDADVTANADIPAPSDMDEAGTKTINVSYEENGVTKTTSYQITVNPIVSTYLTLSGEGIEGSNGVYTLKSGVENEVQLTIDKDGDEEIEVTNPTTFLSFDKTSSILTVNSQTTTNESGTITFTVGSFTAALTVNVSAAEGIQNLGDEEIVTYVGSSFAHDINIQLTNVESATWTLPQGDFIIESETEDNTGFVGTIYFTDEVSGTLTFSALTGKGKTLSVDIEVLAVNDNIKSISASLKSGVTYTAGQGQTFSKDDLTVTYVRDSGAPGTLASNEFTVSGQPEGSFDRVASYSLTITSVENAEATDSLTINVGMPKDKLGNDLTIVTKTSVHHEGTSSTSWNLLTNKSQLDANEKIYLYESSKGYVTGVNGSDATVSTNASDRLEFIIDIVDSTNGTFKLKRSSDNKYISSLADNKFNIAASQSDGAVFEISGDGVIYYTDSKSVTRALAVNGSYLRCYKTGNSNYTYFSAYISKHTQSEPWDEVKYNDNAMTAALYNFIALANEKYNNICDGGTTAPDTTNWDLSSSAEYKALGTNELELLRTCICGNGQIGLDGVYVNGDTNASSMVVEFLQKYDYVVYKYGDAYNYITNRTPTAVPGLVQASAASAMFKNVLANLGLDVMFNEENAPTSWVLLVTIAVAGLATGGYFYIRKRKED